MQLNKNQKEKNHADPAHGLSPPGAAVHQATDMSVAGETPKIGGFIPHRGGIEPASRRAGKGSATVVRHGSCRSSRFVH